MHRGAQLLIELERLASEAETLLHSIVKPGWGGSQHGMPDTLYGYLMGLFARIDLYSAYWRGSYERQSARMVDFMVTYMQVGRVEGWLALHFWRHKLMHTSAPREVRGKFSGRSFRWLLHWSDDSLPRHQHFQFQCNGQVLNLSLIGLIDDTRRALRAYMEALAADPDLQSNYDAVELELASYEVPGV
jgi:hypothetical protein